ncbi:MAG: apolipoprotein N-acyltransferase [Hahellaceae bacterium]|nr:apolipoprotein N-acyltransferase [Hahellaceae bacterium]
MIRPRQLAKTLSFPLAGLMQTASLAPWDYWPLGLLSITLLLYCIHSLTIKQSFWHGWLFGLGLFGSGTSWVYVSIHEYGYASPPLAVALTGLFVAAIAFFPAITLALYKIWANRFASKSTLGLAPAGLALGFCAIWMFGDLFRTWFLNGFPWAFLGYGHLDSPLAGWIPVTGVYGVTFFATLGGSALWTLSQIKNQQTRTSTSLFIALVASIYGGGLALKDYAWSTPSGPTETVAIVQGNIPQKLKWEANYQQKSLSIYSELSAPFWSENIVIWPETAIPLVQDLARPFIDQIAAITKEHQTTFISGIPYREKDPATQKYRYHNSIISTGNGSGEYHKQKLVPFGEFVPLESLLRGLIEFFNLPMSSFSVGPEEQSPLVANGIKVAPYICYEVVYPDFVQRSASQADLLVTISNDSWFGDTLGPIQHLEMAQYRAKENGRYMIRSTNNGISAIINPRGEITRRSPQFERMVLKGEVQPMQGYTPYARAGSWPVYGFAMLFLVGIPAFQLRLRRPA